MDKPAPVQGRERLETAKAPVRPPTPKSPRKKLYELHSWVGFHLAAIMAIVLFTGTMATVSHEIDWLIQHDMRVAPEGYNVSWGTMVQAVRDARPDHTLVSLSSMKGDHFAYRARLVDEHGRQTFVHVNQWTGEITGETHPLTVQRVFRDFHRYLFMPNFIGLPIVCSLAFILSISLYTGLKTARNWQTLLFRIRLDKGARVMIGDAHKSVGLWSLWFFLIVIVTSLWYLFEFGAAASGQSVSVKAERLSIERSAEIGAILPQQHADDIIQAAKVAYPELTPSLIIFPTRIGAPIDVQGHVGNPLVRPRANRVFLDPADLSVLHVMRSQDIGVPSYLNNIADPLHFGSFGGLPTKLIWFVFGLGMTGLSVTGVWLTWRRLKTASPSNAQFATLPVLLLALYFCTEWYGRIQGPAIPLSEQALGEQEIAPGIFVTAYMAKEADGEPNGAFRLALAASEGLVQVQEVHLQLGEMTAQQKIQAIGSPTQIRLTLGAVQPAGSMSLHATIHFVGGAQHEATWRLSDIYTS